EIEIFRVGNQSPLDIASTVESFLDSWEANLPPGIGVRIDSNRAEMYEERLSLLFKNGFIGMIIVMLILSLFLEYRLAFWVMMGMAISFVGSLLFLPLWSVSINMISMFAFLIVLGIVVDDAIVVGENIYEYRRRGYDLIPAAVNGARNIAGPVVFSILTNIVAFVPLMFVPGMMGKFWWPIPAVVITVLGISLLEALFILPAHLGHTPEESWTEPGAFLHRSQQKFADWFYWAVNKYYRPLLEFGVSNRYVVLSAALAILVVVGGYAMSEHMGMIMMPEVSADAVEAGASLPEDATDERTIEVAREVTRQTQKMFKKHNLEQSAEGIRTRIWGTHVDAEIIMNPPGQRQRSVREVAELWRNEVGGIPGIQNLSIETERGPGSWRDDISVDLSHSDIGVLEDASQVFFGRLEQFEATRDVNDNYEKGKRQLDFHLYPEARRLGFTPSYVGRQLRGLIYGNEALSLLRGTNEVEVRVKLPENERDGMYDLEKFMIQGPDGLEAPLMDIARVEMGRAYNSIDRRNGRRVISVGADVEPRSETSRVLTALKQETLPRLRSEFPGLTWSFEGSQAEMIESTQALWGGFILAMLVIYALLAIAFGSYVQPFIVMAGIPFGIIGAVIGHIILGYNLSLISIMGVIGLSGIVVNDSLIMVDYANRQREVDSAYESIVQAGVRRFRPILLTTLTTFGGLVPMIFETSRQALFMVPMAVSLGFGILFSTTIILLMVPCFYMMVEDVKSLVN
ncbi:MAG: efflux RND transporter permease subunit, partial [bacterium]